MRYAYGLTETENQNANTKEKFTNFFLFPVAQNAILWYTVVQKTKGVQNYAGADL